MNCDRCKKRCETIDELVFTLWADEGRHFCKDCIEILRPQLEANFERLRPQREAEMASWKEGAERRLARVRQLRQEKS